MHMRNIAGTSAKISNMSSKVAYFGALCGDANMTLRGFYAPEFWMGGEQYFNKLRNFSVQEKSKLSLSGGLTG